MEQASEGKSGVGAVSGIGATVRSMGDRKFVAGAFLGLALLAGGYAISANSGGGGAPGSSDPSSELLTDQASVISENMKRDAEECAKGTVEGTVGNAITVAVNVHLEMASAMPNVERLFDVNSDCFAGLSSLIDLSFAIPSLATILAAAQDAVLQYARKKICSAVAQVSGMVTSPINQAIGTINQIAGFGNLNGLTAGLNANGGMTLINPNLGSGYNIGSTGTYTTGMPFGNRPQTPVGDSTGGTGGSANYAQVQQLQQQLGTLQQQLGPAMQAAQQAQQQLNACNGMSGGNCAGLQSQAEAAQANLSNIQSQIASLQNQINALLAQGGGAGVGTGSAGVGGGNQATFGGGSKEAPQAKTWTERLGGLFQ